MLNKVQDFFLFNGDFSSLTGVFVVGYLLSVALAVRAKNGNANLFKGSALTIISAWGGKMLVSLMLAEKSAMFEQETNVLFAIAAWYLTGFDEVAGVLKSLPATIALAVMSETVRAHVILECFNAGASVSSKPDWYDVSIVTPIVCGILGGVGSQFLPLSKGLGSLDGWLKWDSKSALGLSLWAQLLTRDKKIGSHVTGLLPFLGNGDMVKFLGVATLALGPILVSLFPDLPNPLEIDAAFKMPKGAGAPRASPARSKSPSKRK